MVINPDTSPRSNEQLAVSEVQPSVLQPVLLAKFAELQQQLLTIARSSETRGRALTSTLLLLTVMTLMACSADTDKPSKGASIPRDTTEQVTPTVTPEPTATMAPTPTIEPSPTAEAEPKFTETTCGPVLQEFSQKWGLDWIAKFTEAVSNSFWCKETKAIWNEPVAQEDVFGDLVVSENLNATFYVPFIPGIPSIPGMEPSINIPVPQLEDELGAEEYLRVPKETLINWILQAPGFEGFMKRLQAEEATARENGDYYGSETPYDAHQRLVKLTEYADESGKLQKVSITIEAALDYYFDPRELSPGELGADQRKETGLYYNPAMREVVLFRFSFDAVPDDTGSLQIDDESLQTATQYIDIGAQFLAEAAETGSTDTIITNKPALEGLTDQLNNFVEMPQVIYGKFLEVQLEYPDDGGFPAIVFEPTDGYRVINGAGFTQEMEPVLELTGNAWAQWIADTAEFKALEATLTNKRFDKKIEIIELREHVNQGAFKEMEYILKITVKYRKQADGSNGPTLEAVVSVTAQPNGTTGALNITTYGVETLITPPLAESAEETQPADEDKKGVDIDLSRLKPAKGKN